jgi:hypothetical protein
MKLSVPERLALLEIMPAKADYSGVKEIYRTTLLLNLDGDEAEEIEVKHIEGMIQFNVEKALGVIKDIPMGEWMTNTFRVILREKSNESDLSIADISLFEKFVLDYE